MNIYYFNDLGDYDVYNPAYFLDRSSAKKLIYLIAKNPYAETKESLYIKTNIKKSEIDEILDGLTSINALTKNLKNSYKVNFPCFYEEDIKVIIKNI